MAEHPGIELERVQPRLFGKVPPLGLLSSGLLLLVAAVALLTLADWVLGPLLLVLALLLLGLYLVAARHLPPSRFARGAAAGLGRARAGLRLAGCSARAWSRAGCRVVSVRHQCRLLRRERDAVQHELGDAAYRQDEAAVERLRARMRELDGAIAGCGQRIQEARLEAQERVAQARVPLRATEIRR